MQAAEFWAMGIEPLAVSAISGLGSGDLMDNLVKLSPRQNLLRTCSLKETFLFRLQLSDDQMWAKAVY